MKGQYTLLTIGFFILLAIGAASALSDGYKMENWEESRRHYEQKLNDIREKNQERADEVQRQDPWNNRQYPLVRPHTPYYYGLEGYDNRAPHTPQTLQPRQSDPSLFDM